MMYRCAGCNAECDLAGGATPCGGQVCFYPDYGPMRHFCANHDHGPSSKTCSCCGVVADKTPLQVRTWTCEDCGTAHDRDVNAAKNLERLASSSAVTACGVERSGTVRNSRVKRSSKKQEETTAIPKAA